MEQFAQAADKDGLITDPDYDGTGDTSAVLLPIAKTVLDLYILKDEEENSTATPPDDIFNEYVTPPKSNPFSSYRSLSLNCATEVLSITTVK